MAPLSRHPLRPRWPRADGFALASTLSLVLFAALVWDAFVARGTARRAIAELSAREAVQSQLVRLDALLQSTTLSAVATQQTQGWIESHRRAGEEIAATFDRMREQAISEPLRTALEGAESARRIKTSIEDQAFDALARGSTEEARTGVRRPEYHEQGHQFSHAMQHFESAQLADAIEGTRRADARLQGSILWATVLFVLLTGLWIALLRGSRRRERLRGLEIQERARGQRALADSLSMYQSLFEASNDMVLLVDASSGRIVDANHQACAALGRTRADLSSLELSEICPRALSAVDDEGITTQLECRDGRRIPAIVRRRRVRVRDREFLQIAARDMSTCRSLEAQLHHAQRMESVGQLAGGIAHEFSNLALVLAGQASLMRDGLVRGRPITDALGRIEAVAAEARRISRSLLCFSGRSCPDRRPVDVRAVARDTVDLLVHVLPPGIRLETDGLQGAPLLARSDEGEIEQILLNLALNARDAMPSGGTLWISCTASGDDELEMVVGDTGTGIPDSELGRIFDPLFTTKPPGSGTGLGLSIVDRIVHQLGGRIRVQTRCGQGSSFTVNLPRLIGDPTAADLDRTDPAQPPRTLTIRLLVDNAAARHLLRTEFEARGHRVQEGPVPDSTAPHADVAIVVGPPPPGPPGPLAARLRAGHVIRVAPASTSASSDADEDSVVFVGVAAPLEELVRLSENLAQLGTGGAI